MPPSTTDLEAAFNRSRLRYQGYSFQTAIACAAIKTCLVRMALIAQNKAASAPAKHYWWQES